MVTGKEKKCENQFSIEENRGKAGEQEQKMKFSFRTLRFEPVGTAQVFSPSILR